jgi:uncharacterized membrane protein YfcA
MLSLSFLGLVFYAVVLVGAFAVRSAAGFGAGLIAVPMFAFILPVPTAVSVAAVFTTLASIGHVSREWRVVAWKQFVIVSIYTTTGIILGFHFLKTLDENTLRRGLGVFLVLYSLHALFARGGPPVLPGRWRSALAAGAGISGGFFGALFGGGAGPIYIIYFNSLRLDRDVFRATMSTIVFVAGAARIVGYANLGLYGGSTIGLLAIGLPLVVAGSWIGDRLAHRLDPRMFGTLVGGLVLLAGIVLVVR